MLILLSTDKLQVNTSGACVLDVHVSFMDNVGGAVNPGRTNTANITAGGTTDICVGPALGAFRNIKTVHIRNRGGPVGLILRHSDGSVAAELYRVNLATEQTLSYIDEIGFYASQPPRPLGGSFVHGLKGVTQTGGTKIDFTYTEGTLRSPTDGSLTFVTSASFTIDIAVQGLNGRDQAAALPDVGIHLYTIWGNAVGSGGIASVNPPPSGPALPVAWTHWAYLTTLRKDAGALAIAHVEGNNVTFDPLVPVLVGGNVSSVAPNPIAPITMTAVVPSIADNILLDVEGRMAVNGDVTAGAAFNAGPTIGGTVSRRLRLDNNGATSPALGVPVVSNCLSWNIPNVGGIYYYVWQPLYNGGAIQSYAADVYVAGYSVSNGG